MSNKMEDGRSHNPDLTKSEYATNDGHTVKSKEIQKPGYNCPVERNPHKDMLAAITMIDDVEVAKWFHRGNHVFTVFTNESGKMKYEAAI